MQVTYFYRKPSPQFHSIEELFDSIQKALPEDVSYKNKYARFRSKGLLKRLYITFESFFHQSTVNHITGDIHFIAFLLRKKRTILTIHDLAPLTRGNFLKRFILKLFWFYLPALRVRFITVISEFTKNELLKYVKVNPNKIIVIPNCVSEILQYKPKNFNVECPVLLQIGTKENKNLPKLFDAIKGIKCKLIIIGKLTTIQKRLLIENQIDYENYYNLEYCEIIAHYEKADIVTFISTYEGFGLPILEANAIGRPVITSNRSPMTEVAANAALFVNPNEVDDMRDGIKWLIEDAEFRNQLITNGLENIKRFSPRAIAEKYTKLYRKIAVKE